MNEKIEELLHYFNIHGGVDSVFGNWVVTKNGDVVNYVYPFAIFCIHLYDCDWNKRIEEKVWFKDSCKENLNKALKRACLLFPKGMA